MQDKYFIPTTFTNEPQQILKAKIVAAHRELELLQQEIQVFSNLLRSHLTNEIIEEQELSVLYKLQKQAKKLKRQEQARKNKNKPEILAPLALQNAAEIIPKINIDQQEKKRLYREAMLQSHPDLFSLAGEKIDLATEVTARLIEIYHSGSLQELRDYHLHIMSGNSLHLEKDTTSSQRDLQQKDRYLEKELFKLKTLIEQAKNQAAYKVLKDYKDPLDYVQELKEYYKDRLFKLRKRTRV